MITTETSYSEYFQHFNLNNPVIYINYPTHKKALDIQYVIRKMPYDGPRRILRIPKTLAFFDHSNYSLLSAR